METAANQDTALIAERWNSLVKPCYVCHGTKTETLKRFRGYKVRCFHCGHDTPYRDTEEKAVNQWNKQYKYANKVS